MIKSLNLLPIFIFCLVSGLSAQQTQVKEDLTLLLNQFLKGASENSIEMHDRFWAEDLIYTSSSGQRYGKETIMAGLQDTDENSDGPETVWTAEDIRIRVYGNGDLAVVAFKLVGKTVTPEGSDISYYMNSGTFVQKNGLWKAVNWQATKVPE